jgi:hypothetical protein
VAAIQWHGGREISLYVTICCSRNAVVLYSEGSGFEYGLGRLLCSSSQKMGEASIIPRLFLPDYFEFINLNAELNPICHLLALLGAHPILHVSRIRVSHLTVRRCLVRYTACITNGSTVRGFQPRNTNRQPSPVSALSEILIMCQP